MPTSTTTAPPACGSRFVRYGKRQLELASFEIPSELAPAQVLVRNDYTAVSAGTEIYNWVHGAEPGREPKFPCGTGYCAAGEVLAVGPEVTDVKPGDRELLLELMRDEQKLNIAPLITHVVAPASCQGAYTMLADAPDKALGVLFKW